MAGEVHSLPDDLKNMVRRLCLDVRYEGIAEFEFKRDADSGEFRLIEINPRSWSWVGITPACGVSLPWIAYTHLAGLPCTETAESHLPDGSVKWVQVLSDFWNCVLGNRHSGFPGWHMSARQWWRSLHADRRVYAEWDIKDWPPACIALLGFLCSLARSAADRMRYRFSPSRANARIMSPASQAPCHTPSSSSQLDKKGNL
jgi:hypothetical protein